MLDAPCKDCPKKGCGSYHDQCPEYQEFRKEKERIYAEKKRFCSNEVELNRLEAIRAWRRRKTNTRLKQR